MLETLYDPTDPHERCGLILKDGSIVEIENIAEDKTNSYEMAPDAVLPFLDAEAIAATWHSHTAPNADPNLSGADHEGFCAYPDLEHHIVGVRDGAITVERYRVDKGVVIVCD